MTNEKGEQKDGKRVVVHNLIYPKPTLAFVKFKINPLLFALRLFVVIVQVLI